MVSNRFIFAVAVSVYTDPSNDVDMETWVLRAFLMATSAAMLAGVAIHARKAW